MKCETNRSGPAFALACLIFCFLGVANAWSQSKSQPKPEAEIIISTLFPPVYPPLAKQTRISGEVQLIVEVGKDGSVTAPVVVQGHPLLAQAAIDSARKSKFECRNCTDEAVFYRLTYSFQLGPTSYCAEATNGIKDNEKEEPYPRVSQSQNSVTLTDRPVGTCDLAGKIEYKNVHSIKCLYIWRCASPRPIGIE